MDAFEGKVRVNGAAVSTQQGRAELLLAPGSFLRLGENSEVTFDGATVQLRNGRAMLEVIELKGPVVIEQNGVAVDMRAPGLYGFDAKHGVITVYAGEAQLSSKGRKTIAGAGFSMDVRSLRKFPLSVRAGDGLFSWSRLRSGQLSAESAAAAEQRNLSGPAWFWVPWANSYTFLSASGAVSGPFGWPYYSPGYTANGLPGHRSGDSFLYGPPVRWPAPAIEPPLAIPTPNSAPYTVPLTAPGVPEFPKNR